MNAVTSTAVLPFLRPIFLLKLLHILNQDAGVYRVFCFYFNIGGYPLEPINAWANWVMLVTFTERLHKTKL